MTSKHQAPLYHPLSTRLKRTRRIHKLTQKQLADLLGIATITIKRCENGTIPQPKQRELIESWTILNEPRAELRF